MTHGETGAWAGARGGVQESPRGHLGADRERSGGRETGPEDRGHGAVNSWLSSERPSCVLLPFALVDVARRAPHQREPGLVAYQQLVFAYRFSESSSIYRAGSVRSRAQ